MSDLDPQQVARRATGHFQPCFPSSRSVNKTVFASKVLRESLDDAMYHLLPWDIELIIDETVDQTEEEPEV